MKMGNGKIHKADIVILMETLIWNGAQIYIVENTIDIINVKCGCSCKAELYNKKACSCLRHLLREAMCFKERKGNQCNSLMSPFVSILWFKVETNVTIQILAKLEIMSMLMKWRLLLIINLLIQKKLSGDSVFYLLQNLKRDRNCWSWEAFSNITGPSIVCNRSLSKYSLNFKCVT